MFGIGGQELVLIAVIALLAVGPRRMPMLMKAIGRTMRELRRATRDLGSQIGLDQVLDDDLRDPLGLRGGTTPKSKARRDGKASQGPSAWEMEQPEIGVDLDETRAREDDV